MIFLCSVVDEESRRNFCAASGDTSKASLKEATDFLAAS